MGWLLSDPVPGSCSKSKQPGAFLTGTFDVERYTVGQPLKKNHPPLVDNYNQAVQRLVAVERNLKMAQYVSNGHVCKIDHEDDKADTIRHLPHHAVFREDKVTYI